MTGGHRAVSLVRSSWSVRAVASIAIVLVTALVVLREATTGRAADAPVTPVRRVHTVETDATIRLPAGLAYSARVDRLFVVESAAGKPAVVARMTPTGRRTEGTVTTTVTLDDPVNIGFDDRRQRLLLAGSGALHELRAPSGRPTSRGARSVPLSALGLSRPRGLAVHPTNGTIYVLDGAGPALVRLTPTDGLLQGAKRSSVTLRGARLGQARGIAFDPGTGHLQVVSGTELVELTTRGVVVARRGLAGLGLGGNRRHRLRAERRHDRRSRARRPLRHCDPPRSRARRDRGAGVARRPDRAGRLRHGPPRAHRRPRSTRPAEPGSLRHRVGARDREVRPRRR